MNMNNLAAPWCTIKDVGNFHATIFKYTRALHVSARYSRQQYTMGLVGQQGSLANTKKIFYNSLWHNVIRVNHM